MYAAHLLLSLVMVSWSPVSDCPKCKPDNLCAPHSEEEQKGIAERRAKLKSKDLGERLVAIEGIAALTKAHENAPSRAVAEAIAVALADDDFEVRAKAAEALVAGQHPDVAVKALIGALDDLREAFARIGRDHGNAGGGAGHDIVSEKGKRYVAAVIEGLGKLPDDRCVDALAAQLKQLSPDAPSDFVVPIAQALERLGSREALRAIVSRLVAAEGTGSRARNGGAGKGGGAGGGAGGGTGGGAGGGAGGGSGGGRPGRPGDRDGDGYRDQGASEDQRKALHQALADAAASKQQKDVPAFDDQAAQAWKDWLEKHLNAFPAKLGRVGSTPVKPGEAAAKGG